MKKMKLFALSLLMAVTLFGCGDDYDDTALRNDVNDLKSRVEKLEAWCATANGQITALQGLVSALELNDYVTGVTPVMEGTEEVGYTITFAKSDPITIRHGKNGTNGINGKDGKDGITPIIGVAKADDGLYYWTIKIGDAPADWLTDADGNKIRTTGNDGAAGKPGIDGKPGADGSPGTSGHTPVISVDSYAGKFYWKIDGEWLLSDGEKVPATGEKGETGATGPQGDAGDSMFSDVTYNETTVTFTLSADGTTLTLPRAMAITVGKNDVATDGMIYISNEPATAQQLEIGLPSGTAASDVLSILAEVKNDDGTTTNIATRAAAGNGWGVRAKMPTTTNRGYVELTPPSNASDGDVAWLQVTVLLRNGLTASVTCVLKVGTKPVPITTEAGLKAAIAAATGTADQPAQITLSASFAMGDNAYINIGDASGGAKHITIDGGGKTITRGSEKQIFKVVEGSSLTLNNIILDGNNRATGDFLVIAHGGSTITLGNGAVLQNLKNLEIPDFAVFPSSGIALTGSSTLVMNAGSSIANIERYAINSNDNTQNQVIFNGGSLSGCAWDVFMSGINSMTTPILISTWPTLDGNRKMNVNMEYIPRSEAWSVVVPQDGYSSLALENFTFVVTNYNNGADITDQCDIFKDSDGIIKIKQKE